MVKSSLLPSPSLLHLNDRDKDAKRKINGKSTDLFKAYHCRKCFLTKFYSFIGSGSFVRACMRARIMSVQEMRHGEEIFSL